MTILRQGITICIAPAVHVSLSRSLLCGLIDLLFDVQSDQHIQRPDEPPPSTLCLFIITLRISQWETDVIGDLLGKLLGGLLNSLVEISLRDEVEFDGCIERPLVGKGEHLRPLGLDSAEEDVYTSWTETVDLLCENGFDLFCNGGGVVLVAGLRKGFLEDGFEVVASSVFVLCILAEGGDAFSETSELHGGLLLMLCPSFPECGTTTFVASIDEILSGAEEIGLVEKRFDAAQTESVGDGFAEKDGTEQILESGQVGVRVREMTCFTGTGSLVLERLGGCSDGLTAFSREVSFTLSIGDVRVGERPGSVGVEPGERVGERLELGLLGFEDGVGLAGVGGLGLLGFWLRMVRLGFGGLGGRYLVVVALVADLGIGGLGLGTRLSAGC